MEMINLHKYYYKDYFDLDKNRKANEKSKFEYILENNPKGDKILVSGHNSKLTDTSFSHKIGDDYIPNTIIGNECDEDNQSFQLKITYPGLVTGVGISHEAKIEGEFKLGVHFDYTYGMPVVYGSSVKGVLRSAFKMKDKNGNNAFFDEVFITDVNNKHKVNIDFTQFKSIIKALEEDIFEGKGCNGNKSIYNRDIFFDAVLTKADPKGRILCSDSITPHGDNPLTNPTPITFMKIAPGCEMEFRFKLVDTKLGDFTFSKEQKKALFEEILKTIGIGAKSNVGYGQFQ